ncbi:MAG: methyltransferase family protein [Burkholderiaceae bacterium]
MSFLEHKIPPPVIGAIAALTMWGVSGLGPALAFATSPKYVMVAFLVIAGLAFDLLGLLAFRASRTTINPLKPERTTALVTSGVYKITRNPMYVGMSLLLLAWAVWLSALLPFAGPVVFVLYITRFQIQPEERVLLELFGEEYATYALRVRRWL